MLPQIVSVKTRVWADDNFRQVTFVKLFLLLIGVGWLFHTKAEQLFEDEKGGENCADYCEAVLGCAELPEEATADSILHHNSAMLMSSSGGY